MLIADMKARLRWPGVIRYVAWGVLRRKAVYGWTEASVRRQLVKVIFCGRAVYVHTKVATSVKRVNDRIRAYERRTKKKSWYPDRVESFNWRVVRGGSTLSRHAHAIALDIDPVTNAYNGTTTDLPSYVVQAFVDEGWEWGGRWTSPRDPMHFQRH